MMQNILQIFAKAPIPGQVKTRLIPTLGAVGAADLHKALVQHLLQKFHTLFTLQLWCTSEHPFFQSCQTQFNISLHLQVGNDLGQRMAYALGKEGATVLIGSDCPTLSVSHIQEAFVALKQGIVLTPAEDGGYVLIGMQTLTPELLNNIPWGTSQVLKVTRNRLRDLSMQWHELPTQWDIDRPEDVARWNKRKQ